MLNFLKETAPYVREVGVARDTVLKEEFNLYQELEKKSLDFFYAGGSKAWQEYLEDVRENEGPLNIFENISYTYWNIGALGYYRKSSYRDEAEKLLKKGYLYRIGHAKDDQLLAKESNPSIMKVIQKNMSTEICYDLELGVRKAFASYPEELKIHVVPSNVLPVTHRNIDNLPDNGSIIFHVDPEYTELLVRNKFQLDLRDVKHGNELFNKFKHHKFIRKSPFLSLQLMTDNNLYTFSVWRLDEAIRESQ